MAEQIPLPQEPTAKGIAWESLVKAIAWPLVAILAIVLFREQITELIPRVDKFAVGTLSIEAKSNLGGRASADVLSALEGLTLASISTLILHSTPETCFYDNPTLGVESARNQRAQLIKKGVLEELSTEQLKTVCKFQNPVVGWRLTILGERVRDFQLSVLSELSAPAQGR
jgi:hypothetical protein